MANKLQIKRTSVSGRTPNTTSSGNTHFIDTGELALNLTDGKLFSSNGSAYFEVGANLSSVSVSGNTTVGGGIVANGTAGVSGQVLKTSGSGVYWGDVTGSGDVVGPSSSTNNALVIFDGETGKVIKDSPLVLNVYSSYARLHAESITDVTASPVYIFETGVYNSNSSSANTKYASQYFDISGPNPYYGYDVGNQDNLHLLSYYASPTRATYEIGTAYYYLDANNLTIKNSGGIRFAPSGGNWQEIRPYPIVSSNTTWILPSIDGANGQVLSTDGFGQLGWANSGSGDVVGPASSTNNALAVFDGTTGKLLKESNVFVSGTGQLNAENLKLENTGASQKVEFWQSGNYIGDIGLDSSGMGIYSANTEVYLFTGGSGGDATGFSLLANGQAVIYRTGGGTGESQLVVGSPSVTATGALVAVHSRYGDQKATLTLGMGSTVTGLIEANTNGDVRVGSVSNSFSIESNNTQRLRFNIDGAFGIGSSPSYGTAGQMLTSNGSANSPYWKTPLSQVNTGVGLSGGPITTTGTVSILANTGIVANATGLYVNSSYIATLAANSATYVGGNTAADLQTYADNKAANAYSNAVSVAASDASSKAATAYSNATSYADTKAATAYSNAVSTAASDASSKAATAYSNAVSYVDGKSYVNTSQLSSNLSNYALLSGASFTGNVVANNITTSYDLTVGRNLTVSGNLTISGTATVMQGNSVTFTDNMLYLNNGILATITNISGNGTYVTFTANNNYQAGWDVVVSGVNPSSYNGTYDNIFSANATHFVVANTNTDSYVSGGTARGKTDQNPDIGLAAGYNDGTYHHTGIFRDASDGYWKVFDNYSLEPDASVNIDTTDASFHLANFQANSLILGNTSTNWFTANSSVVNASSFYVGTTLVANSTGPYGKTEASLNVNSALTSNSSTYLGGNTAADLQTYANNKAANAYSNATSYADGKAATAYSNAVSAAATDASSKAATAYSNAVAYSSNADNISSGTLNAARLPASVVQNTDSRTLSGNLVISGTYFNPSSNTILLGNTTQRWVVNANTGNFSGDVSINGNITLSNNNTSLVFTDVGGTTASSLRLQNDDNFVFYLSNTSGGQRPIYAIYANSTTSNLQIFAPLQPQGGIVANGSLGGSATVLKSNGSGGIYWDVAGGTGTVTQVNTGIGLSGGPITTTGTVSVLANTGIVANSTGLFVNSSYIGTLSANNSSFLDGVAAASYVQNTDSRTLSGNLSISGTYFNPSSNTILLGNSTQRWVVSGNTGDFSGALTTNGVLTVGSGSGNTVVNSVSVNAVTHYAGAINATSNGFLANSSTIIVGNTSVNTSILPASATFGGTVTIAANVTGADAVMTRMAFKDTAWAWSNSGSNSTFDYTNGSVQRWAPSSASNPTITVNNWPPTGTLGELLIEGVSLSTAGTISLAAGPTYNILKSDGTYATSFSTSGVIFTSGTDWILMWTRDAGTTIYLKVMR